MSIFGTLLRKIFPSNHPSAQTQQGSGTSTAPAQQQADMRSASSSQQQADVGIQSRPQPMTEVDVEAILNDMAKSNPQKLNWRTSIVDLMKLVGMDSSLNARKELARELNYSGSTSDTAAMNIWLHKQVMKKLAENGGKVPADLMD